MRRFLAKLRRPILYSVYGYTVYLFGENIGRPIIYKGPSMQPTLQEWDIIWSSRFHFKEPASPCGNLKEGDIVCLVNPAEPDAGNVMKRIKAISDGYVELRGDNQANSLDSRHYGPVHISRVRYKAEFIVYPWKRRGRGPLAAQADEHPPETTEQ